MKQFDYYITYSSRKTVGLCVRDGHTVEIKAPRGTPDSRVQEILRRHEAWILRHLEKRRESVEKAEGRKYTYEELDRLADQALKAIPPLVRRYAETLRVSVGRITVRNQKTRWGSCSSAGNLNFNCLLMLAPRDVLEYVVVHELCHRLEMNHSPRFWALVGQTLPGYRTAYDWLKKNGQSLLDRLP